MEEIQHTHSCRECLSRLFSSQPLSKQSVMKSIVKNEDVFFSSAKAAETESPANSNELLWYVVELWLTINLRIFCCRSMD